MLFFALSAFAHLPHDVVLDVVAGGSVPAQGPWLALLSPARTTALYRTRDGGRNWVPLGGDPTSELLVEGVGLDDGTLVLRSETSLWWSRDQGTHWDSAPLPDVITTMAGGELLLLGSASGVWAGPPSALNFSEISGGIQYLSSAHGSAVGVGDGGIWKLDALGWVGLGAAPGPTSSVSVGPLGIFLGDTEGKIWKFTGVWEACGELMVPADPTAQEHREIVAMDQGTLALVVTPGWQAPFVSEDSCQTWQDRSAPLNPVYGGEGAAGNSFEGFSSTLLGEALLVGGWMGAASSTDLGQTWREAYLLGSGYTRGIAFASDFASSRRVFTGSLGAGVVVFDETGRKATPARGFLETNTQGVWTAESPNVLFSIVGHKPWKSVSTGREWAPLASFSYAGTIHPWSDDRIWLVGTHVDGTKGLFESLDGGMSWTAMPEMLSMSTDFYTISDGRTCIITLDPALFCSHEADWELIWTPSSPVEAVAPFGAGLLMADGEGVWNFDGQTVVLLAEHAQDPVITMAAATETLAYGVTRSGWIVELKEDGSENLNARMDSEVTTLVASPEWEVAPSLLAATLDGIYQLSRLDSARPELVRWQGQTWVDDRASMVGCVGCVLEEAERMALSSVTRVGLGQKLRGGFQGQSVQIYGVVGAEEGGTVRIDGKMVAELAPTADTAVTVIFETGGLGEGWHSLEIVGTGPLGLRIDGYVGNFADIDRPFDSGGTDSGGNPDSGGAESGPDIITYRENRETDGCGCEGGSASLFLLGIWGVTRGQRAREKRLAQ